MILKIFTVLDDKAGAHITPFFMPQTAMAERVFGQMVLDQEHQFSKSPADFTLYEIGEYDDASADISPLVPKHILNGSQVRANE